MKKIIVFGLIITSISPSVCEEKPNLQQLEDLLAQEAPDAIIFRAPAVPDSLGDPLGAVQFKGFNGSTFDFGASLNGYYGIVGSGTAAPNVTMPGNIGMGTVPVVSAVNNLTSRLLISALGRIGVGNFVPGTGTNNGLPNSVLNVEGDNSASANSAVHVGSRVVAIDPLISGTAYSTQIDGNCYGVQYSQFNTQLNITRTFNIVQATFIRATDLPLTINTPGLYVLAENVSITTVATAITINAGGEGSVIDFNDFTLSGGGIAQTGILLNNTSDITIKNGRITRFPTAIGTSGTNNINITVERINTNDCGQAIDFSGTTTSNGNWLVNDCQFTNGSVIDNVVTVTRVHNSVFMDCVVNNYGGSTPGANLQAFVVQSCANVLFKNCIVTDCNNANGSFFSFNIISPTSTGIIFDSCDSSGNTSTNATRSFRSSDVNNASYICVNCTASNTQGVSVGTFNVLTTGSSTAVMKDCISAGNRGTGDLAVGFFAGNRVAPVVVENCISYANSSTTASLGFLRQGSNAMIHNCIAFGQTGAAATIVGIRFFLDEVTDVNSCVTNCITFGQNVGIQLFATTGMTGLEFANQILGNISTKNTTDYSGFPAGSTQTAAGIASINGSLTIPLVNVSVT